MAVVPGEAWAEKAAAVADSDQLLTIGHVERTLRGLSGHPEGRRQAEDTAAVDAPGVRRLFRAFSGFVVIFQQGRLRLHFVTY